MERTDAPWSLRLFERMPLAPAWTGVVITLAWFGLYVAYAYPLGWLEDPPGESSVWLNLGLELFWALLIGYMPAATAISLRGAARDLHRLRPTLHCSDAEFEDRRRELTHFDSRHLISIGVLGVVGGLLLPFAPGFWVESRPPLGDPNLTWVWVRGAVFSWLLLRTLYIEVATARRFSHIGSRWTRVDLLDLDPLAPFARRGLGSVLLLVGLAVLFSVQFAAPWKTGYLTVATQLSFLAVAITAMLLPVLGVHRSIKSVKGETLARLVAEIRSQGDPTLEPRADSRLPDLIAYKGLIESVPTWPFDVSTVLRFGFYVTVGLLSWLGSAFVERVLDSALGAG